MDARMPERYLVDRRIVRLPHPARSSYFMATLWSVSNRTDGRIERDDLALIPTFEPTCVDALVAASLWEQDDTGDAWMIADYMSTQTSRADFEVLENARRADREKKRRQRAAKATAESQGVSPGHVPGDSTGKEGKARPSSRASISGTGQVADHDSIDISAIENRDVASVVIVDTDNVFERVWALWPKKTSKKVAAAKFTLAARRHPRGLHGLADDVAAHARAYQQHAHPVQYVPMLSTWLHADRWEDPLPGPRGHGSTLYQNASVLRRYASPEGGA